MFGITFPELMVILVVALVFIGPEQLPKVARTLGMLWGRGQRYVNGIKSDIARDLAVEEFRQMQQQVQQQARDAHQALQQGADNINQSVSQQVNELNKVTLDQATLPPKNPEPSKSEPVKPTSEPAKPTSEQ